jgi:small subunit ribosomal protein S1
VKILEIDSERRRLSLSLKRVEDQVLPLREGAPPPDDASEATAAEDLGEVRDLGLSEDVFANAETAEEPPPEEPPVETHPNADDVPAEEQEEEPAQGEDQPA